MNYKDKLNQIKYLLKLEVKLSEAILEDGTVVSVEELAVGYPVTINGEPAPTGEHKLNDGRTIVLDENGVILEIKEAPVSNEIEMQLREATETLLSEIEVRDAEIVTLKSQVVELQDALAKTKVIEPNPEPSKKVELSEMTPLEKFRYFKKKTY